MPEVWKDVVGHPGYQVSESGGVRRLKKKGWKVFKPQITSKGYARVSLKCPDGRVVHRKIHRLVAFAFLDGPPDDMRTHINHKDGVKLNNHHTNLEWVSSKENIVHAIENDLITRNLRVRIYDTVTGHLEIVPSMEAVAARFNIKIMTVKRYLGRYPVLKFEDRYLFEPLLAELAEINYPRAQAVIAYDYVGGKTIVAPNLGVMTLLSGVATTTMETHLKRGFMRLLGGYVFKYLKDKTPFPEYTVVQAKASREKYLSRKPRVLKNAA
ncbi:NUMOD4 domain-containing protein [Streptomyces sp. CHB9.2]|uniref:NUMOD4 domain-containing protein n=1 Tax=Streptomyces sp. CHB9.2 TaxID=2841670 RepID=UPI0020951A95|nr:NUMOD4 domain-containing protein [Streptomyces sp. CHB9.2]MCO6704891.1 NUMOD4 motif-containing HNH endonuclease [Streptomyces sp. CHB9.2]